MMRMSKLIIITGTSAAGKSTIVHEIMSKQLLPVQKFITCTTRTPRAGEKNGVEYWFLSQEEFERELQAGHFLESARVYDKWYGSSRIKLEQMLLSETDVLMIIDVQGARAMKQLYPDALVIFIDAEDDMLRARLKDRGANPADIEARFGKISEERGYKKDADLCVDNSKSDVGFAVQAIVHFLE